LIIPLAEAWESEDALVGGKARSLGRLMAAGYRVPAGFCIATPAYERFLEAGGLADIIHMELGRKAFSEMRWEEIWDAALRMRTAFLAAPLPTELVEPILDAYGTLEPGEVAVRSSAPGEDAAERSFAGLHESRIGVGNAASLLDAVRIVWASLWSDAALLYRRELGLDVAHSRMAVVVQEFEFAPVSGVAFGRDPRAPRDDRQIVEAVPGGCEDLVSGAIDPDRWTIKRSTGEPESWRPGHRPEASNEPLLDRDDLEILHTNLLDVEELLGYPPDIEWTGQATELTLLQARPMTGAPDEGDERTWYLSLRPGDERLAALCERVTNHLIPALAEEGARLTAEDLTELADGQLADAIDTRAEAHERWKTVYKKEFIPFAHGVRRFGQYYNDALRPEDPYAFVELLEHQPMMASERNHALAQLADQVRKHPALSAWLEEPQVISRARSRGAWDGMAAELQEIEGGEPFRRDLDAILDQHMNLAFQNESLDDRPDLVLSIVRQLASEPAMSPRVEGESEAAIREREEEFLAAVGTDRRQEAQEMLRVGRLSWKLRDDDNILMGRLRNQLRHAVALAAERLEGAGRLAPGPSVGIHASGDLSEALRSPDGGPVSLPTSPAARETREPLGRGVSVRQLIGQPAAHGLATGNVCVVEDAEDFRRFRKGEILVCDAVQPTMTHLVPLASGIVERRGGMLIHGAIIARELGVPCVNGVPNATDLLKNGDWVTVDGTLGIVTVGPPSFELEVPEEEGCS
jgi:pyruvate,water dikinase